VNHTNIQGHEDHVSWTRQADYHIFFAEIGEVAICALWKVLI